MSPSRLFARSLVLAAVFVGPAVAVSCGGSSSDKPSTPTQSTGGSAGMPAVKPDPITCGADTCEPLTLPAGFEPKYVAPCCTAESACGIDSTPLEKFNFVFAEKCQATNQPGDADEHCPMSPELMIPTSAGTVKASGFPGCCRADTHTCGYLMNKFAGLVPLDPPLGCVDSAPFLDGGAPSACGSASGAAGTGN